MSLIYGYGNQTVVPKMVGISEYYYVSINKGVQLKNPRLLASGQPTYFPLPITNDTKYIVIERMVFDSDGGGGINSNNEVVVDVAYTLGYGMYTQTIHTHRVLTKLVSSCKSYRAVYENSTGVAVNTVTIVVNKKIYINTLPSWEKITSIIPKLGLSGVGSAASGLEGGMVVSIWQ